MQFSPFQKINFYILLPPFLFFLVFFTLNSSYVVRRNGVAINRRLVCYYNFPSGITDLQPEKLDANLCTHIILSFFSVNETFQLLEVSTENLDVLNRVVGLKNRNGELKVMISVGGAGNVNNWSGMVSNHRNRKRFIRSVRIFLKHHRLDGIDLDWEFPNSMGINPKERLHFTQLLEEFRMHIERNSYKFLLSVAVPNAPFRIDESYQINYLNSFTDFINVMCYDFHFYSSTTPFTGLNSPLFRSSLDKGIFSTMNVNDSLNYFEENFMDKKKINVGLPVYGHTFKLFNRFNNGLYAPAQGFGEIGSKGFARYPEILNFLNEGNVEKHFDSIAKSNFAAREFEWISFEDEISLKFKTEFVRNGNYGGIMIYDLNSDDSNFTLIRTVKKTLD